MEDPPTIQDYIDQEINELSSFLSPQIMNDYEERLVKFITRDKNGRYIPAFYTIRELKQKLARFGLVLPLDKEQELLDKIIENPELYLDPLERNKISKSYLRDVLFGEEYQHLLNNIYDRLNDQDLYIGFTTYGIDTTDPSIDIEKTIKNRIQFFISNILVREIGVNVNSLDELVSDIKNYQKKPRHKWKPADEDFHERISELVDVISNEMRSVYAIPSRIKYKGGKKNKKSRKWSQKYKKSINCKRPRGFSQKQYCKYGRNKNKNKNKSTRNKNKNKTNKRRM